MSLSPYVESFRAPLAGTAPCGEDLESTTVLAELGRRRLLGEITPLGDDHDWRALREQSLAALERSHDLRLLPYLMAAVLRLESIPAGLSIIEVARHWLDERWDGVYPLLEDGDVIVRIGAVSGLADRMAIVDALRRATIVRHRQFGPLTLRHVDLMQGKLKIAGSEKAPTEAQIRGAIDATEAGALQLLTDSVASALDSLEWMRKQFLERSKGRMAPDFSLLTNELRALQQLLKPVEREGGFAGLPAVADDAAQTSDSAAGSEMTPAAAPGPIRSRQDAIRALDAVAAFFRANEPSSPVPLFVERARRLVGKDFLELVTDVAPEALGQVRLVGGLRDDA